MIYSRHRARFRFAPPVPLRTDLERSPAAREGSESRRE